MPSLPPKPESRERLFEQLARIGSALSNPARLRLLSLLSHGERTLEDLAALTDQTPAAASAQLKVLRNSALVVAEKRGRFVWFRLANDEALRFWLQYRNFAAAQLPETRELIRDLFESGEELSRISLAELAVDLKAGHVTLIDLRPPSEYAVGHLPGAINIPAITLEDSQILRALLAKHPAGPLYAYCRGPWCLMALNGTRRLREMGLPVERLSFSYPEWKAAGMN